MDTRGTNAQTPSSQVSLTRPTDGGPDLLESALERRITTDAICGQGTTATTRAAELSRVGEDPRTSAR